MSQWTHVAGMVRVDTIPATIMVEDDYQTDQRRTLSIDRIIAGHFRLLTAEETAVE